MAPRLQGWSPAIKAHRRSVFCVCRSSILRFGDLLTDKQSLLLLSRQAGVDLLLDLELILQWVFLCQGASSLWLFLGHRELVGCCITSEQRGSLLVLLHLVVSIVTVRVIALIVIWAIQSQTVLFQILANLLDLCLLRLVTVEDRLAEGLSDVTVGAQVKVLELLGTEVSTTER
jgi:hypothetical protein